MVVGVTDIIADELETALKQIFEPECSVTMNGSHSDYIEFMIRTKRYKLVTATSDILGNVNVSGHSISVWDNTVIDFEHNSEAWFDDALTRLCKSVIRRLDDEVRYVRISEPILVGQACAFQDALVTKMVEFLRKLGRCI